MLMPIETRWPGASRPIRYVQLQTAANSTESEARRQPTRSQCCFDDYATAGRQMAADYLASKSKRQLQSSTVKIVDNPILSLAMAELWE